ncbi:MAG: hypothetical protein ABSG40_22630 [Terriglobales bacterium]|jgi:hypothetical protein
MAKASSSSPGGSGLVMTVLGIALAFFPANQITSLWKYGASMVGIALGFIVLAVFFFFVYGRLKAPRAVVSPAGRTREIR